MSRALAVALAALFFTGCSPAGTAGPSRFGRVPDFSLTESDGRNVTLQDLQGGVWIADFIFTSCSGTCPVMTARMRQLQDTLPAGIKLVSFTVDPARDTPAVLAKYASAFRSDNRRWMFLTGERQALYDLSMKGFKLGVDDTQGSAAEPITHSTRFALVDRKGEIRGYYSGTEEDDLQRLSKDAAGLL